MPTKVEQLANLMVVPVPMIDVYLVLVELGELAKVAIVNSILSVVNKSMVSRVIVLLVMLQVFLKVHVPFVVPEHGGMHQVMIVQLIQRVLLEKNKAKNPPPNGIVNAMIALPISFNQKKITLEQNVLHGQPVLLGSMLL